MGVAQFQPSPYFYRRRYENIDLDHDLILPTIRKTPIVMYEDPNSLVAVQNSPFQFKIWKQDQCALKERSIKKVFGE